MPSQTITNIDQITHLSTGNFDHWMGDWDADGIVNIDDPNPLTPGDTAPVSEAELAPQIKAVIEAKNNYIPALKKVMKGLLAMNLALVVKGRIKEVYSTLGKLIRKRFPFTEKIATKSGEKYTTGLTDVAGCMAIAETQEQVDQIVKRILS
ncbi:MAG: hypothetical protein ABJ059_00695, partial [Hyphomicrobiales bacterium]